MRRGNAIEKAGGGAQAAARAKRAANDADSRNLVGSLAKGLRVLESFTADRPELTLSEVAGLAKLDPGTCFRMLNTLVMLGYVDRVPESRRFRLTLKVTDLGFHAIGRADLREVARPILRSLVGELNEAASLGVLDGADVVYIDRIRAGLTRIGVDIRIGTTIPAYCSAIGQAIMAYLPSDELARLLAMRTRSETFPSKPMGKDEIRARSRRRAPERLCVAQFLFRQRTSHSGRAGARSRRLSARRSQRRGAGHSGADQGIQEPRARAGPPRRQRHRPHHPGERDSFSDCVEKLTTRKRRKQWE